MKRSLTYTPAVSGERNTGRNARIAMSVAPRSGIAVFLPIAVSASMRGFPLFRSTRMPSIMTMALSTSIPIARINAPKDTRCILPSAIPRSRKEPMTITMRDMPMIMPLLMPITSMSIAITITTDSMRLMKNVESASVTRSG